MTRILIIVLGLALACLIAPQAVYAQQKPVRIGTLLSGSPKTHAHYIRWFREGMRDLGYMEGKDFVLVSRWGRGKRKRLAALAMELVRVNVDVMMVVGVGSLRAARKATRKIPIVVGNVANIVESGYVKSLANPGGNITGSSFDRDQLNGKRLGLLREAHPNARRVAFLNSRSQRSLRDLKRIKVASKAMGFQVQPWPVRTHQDIDTAIRSMARERIDSLLIPISTFSNFHRKRIADVAMKMRLPTMCSQESYARAGCLMSYTVDRRPLLRRAASFIDRIIKGAGPAALPVEMASRYKLVVNLKTAKALGITLPPSILLQATEVIE
jgi:putative ABC transport system substrate-binding protein